jgi:hypothetical protein
MPEDPNEGNNLSSDAKPSWMIDDSLSKFKSDEDLARSYLEAEKKIREQGTQLNAMNENFASLSEQLEELQAGQQQQPQQQYDWREAYENDPIGTQALLTQQVVAAELAKFQQTMTQTSQPLAETQNALVADFAARAVEAKFEDWADFRDAISEEIRSDPYYQDDRVWANPAVAQNALEKAYFVAKGKALNDGTIQVGTQSARDLKLAAQGLQGGQSGRQENAPESAEQAWERIRSAGGSDYQSLMAPSKS